MALLEYNEIKERKYVIVEDEPYEVLTSHVFRKQQRKPVNQVKMRNLITGRVLERSFGVSEKAEEAEIEKKEIKYLFHKYNRQTEVEEYWFSEINNPGARFFLKEDLIGPQKAFLKANEPVTALLFNDEIFGVNLPIKIAVKVTEAAPAVPGNTAQGATKQVKIETGATITTPLFIKEGEMVIVNTETGEYVERVKN